MTGAFIFLLLFLVGTAVPAFRTHLESNLFAALLCYGSMATLLLFALPRVSVRCRGVLRRAMRVYALTAAAIFIALRFVSAVFMKSLKGSPYDSSVFGIARNALLILLPLMIREGIRAYGLGLSRKHIRYRTFSTVLLTLFFTLLELNVQRALRLEGAENRFVFLAETVLPTLARNALQTGIVLSGGMWPSVLYGGSIALFERIFPFLPDLPWLANAAIGLCFPVFFLFFVRERFRMEEFGEHPEPQGSSLAWYAELFAAVIFYWFCVGVFPVYPTVILTGSMEPVIHPGDVVLVQKLREVQEIEALSEGTVISFQRGDISITHRILAVREDEAGNRSFITKGDNNPSADIEPVNPNDISGIVIRVVPRVGMPVLLLNSRREVPTEVQQGLREETVRPSALNPLRGKSKKGDGIRGKLWNRL